jgi:hypothetical protein
MLSLFLTCAKQLYARLLIHAQSDGTHVLLSCPTLPNSLRPQRVGPKARLRDFDAVDARHMRLPAESFRNDRLHWDCLNEVRVPARDDTRLEMSG